MKTNRSIKTTTALATALAAAEIDKATARDIIKALKRAAKAGTATSGARITHHVDGLPVGRT